MLEIPLTQNQVALIDDIDADLAYFKWHASFRKNYSSGMFVAQRNRKTENGSRCTDLMHRVILSRIIGYELDRNDFVDHINNNPLDNRRSNLRIATNSENQSNRERLNTNNFSGFRGVSWHKLNSKWQARIRHQRKFIQLGYFDTPESAARAYDLKAVELFGDFAAINF